MQDLFSIDLSSSTDCSSIEPHGSIEVKSMKQIIEKYEAADIIPDFKSPHLPYLKMWNIFFNQ